MRARALRKIAHRVGDAVAGEDLRCGDVQGGDPRVDAVDSRLVSETGVGAQSGPFEDVASVAVTVSASAMQATHASSASAPADIGDAGQATDAESERTVLAAAFLSGMVQNAHSHTSVECSCVGNGLTGVAQVEAHQPVRPVCDGGLGFTLISLMSTPSIATPSLASSKLGPAAMSATRRGSPALPPARRQPMGRSRRPAKVSHRGSKATMSRGIASAQIL